MQWNVFRKQEGKKSTREANCWLLHTVLVSFARTNYENQQRPIFETCPWRWALIFGNTQIHAQIPAPCLFLPFCGSLSVWETAQRSNRVWQEKAPTHKEKVAERGDWIDTSLTTYHRKFNTSTKKSQLPRKAIVLQQSPWHVIKPGT